MVFPVVILSFLLFPKNGRCTAKLPAAENTVIEFHYRVPKAVEIYLVWGVNGWRSIPENQRPEKTVLREGVMETPMQADRGLFHVRLTVPMGSRLDYGYQIRRTRTEPEMPWAWDGDFRLVASGPKTVERKTSIGWIRFRAWVYDQRIPMVLLTAGLLILTVGYFFSGVRGRSLIRFALGFNAARRESWIKTCSPRDEVLATALTLLGFLAAIRAFLLEYHWKDLLSPVRTFFSLSAAVYDDGLYVSGLTALFLVLLIPAARWKGAPSWVAAGFRFVSVLSLVAALINVPVVHVLKNPFNLRWLYYSDFLTSADAHSAISFSSSWTIVLIAAAMIGAMMIVSGMVGRIIGLLPKRENAIARIGLAAATGIYLVTGSFAADRMEVSPGLVENPVVEFASSLVFHESSKLFTMHTSLGADDFAPKRKGASQTAGTLKDSKVRIRNILIIVLESVPDEYVGLRFERNSVTPEIDRWSFQSLRFTKFYAHAPATNKSLFSILTSRYPWISYRSLTEGNPNAPLSSLGPDFKRRGYRTALFLSGDARFQNQREFVSGRGFDFVEDVRDRSCTTPSYLGETENLNVDGSDDACTVESLLRWIDAGPDRPFMALLWTNMTHYPYFVSGPEEEFGVQDRMLNRYLNALHHSDQAFGKVMRKLTESSRMNSTLVVLLGDHGEAFGRHGQIAHAGHIYEENVHIPLILFNPILFHGEKSGVIGGLIDIAPTVESLLGWTVPNDWQGRSLFDPDRTPRIYFFAPWSQLEFGFRENDMKFIYNAATDKKELYDLAADPQETRNLAGQEKDRVAIGMERLAAWVQYQRSTIEPVIRASTTRVR